MPSERDKLRRALGRLGSVPPEKLGWSRGRVRRNLESERGPTAPLPPPDATPADLTVLRRPFYVGGATALLGLLMVGGAVGWRFERRSASTRTVESQAMIQAPRPAIEAPPVAPAPPKKQPAIEAPVTAATQPQVTQPPAADAPPVQAPRPRVQLTLLPPGEGKVILDRACDGCHRAASVGAYHYATRAQYADVVARMIAMGAQVSEQEAPVLTDYLFKNLAAKPALALDTAGQALLERACTSCHDLNGIENYSYDSEDPYRELVSTMVSYGAPLSDAEEETLIKYLFTTYGKR